MPNLTMFLFLNTAITIPTEVAEISTYVFMISKIGILLIDGVLDDQLLVSERLIILSTSWNSCLLLHPTDRK